MNARETETRERVRSRSGTYRSFTDEHGLKNSALAYIVTPSGARRLILTMGVSPIVSRMLSYRRALGVTATARRAGAARRARTWRPPRATFCVASEGLESANMSFRARQSDRRFDKAVSFFRDGDFGFFSLR